MVPGSGTDPPVQVGTPPIICNVAASFTVAATTTHSVPFHISPVVVPDAPF
jgi:hypothetical protein